MQKTTTTKNLTRERPILFSGPEVRAILDGRKTQTRRIIKNATGSFWDHGAYKPLVGGDGIVGWQDPGYRIYTKGNKPLVGGDGIVGWHDQGYRIYTKGNGAPCPHCPQGKIGDLLWVRETWQEFYDDEWPKERPRGPRGLMGCPATPDRKSFVFYRADGDEHPVSKYGEPVWIPSSRMPRWASRITLEITNVRVERLQAISEEDALADGGLEYKKCPVHCSPRMSFADLWQSVHGHESWDANPWVWVIEFKKEVGK